jgi:hypothetical protein
LKLRKFKKIIKEAPYVFIIFISNISVIRLKYFINTVNTTLALKLPAEFEEYKDVFNIE